MNLADMLQAAEIEEKQPKQKEQEKTKKETKVKKKATKTEQKKSQKNDDKKYRYPFILWMDRKQADVSHIFEDGKEYSENEISNLMLEHGDYDFSGKVNYDYLKDKNVLAVSFQKHSKG